VGQVVALKIFLQVNGMTACGCNFVAEFMYLYVNKLLI